MASEPREAATVMLLRDGRGGGVETWLLRRVPKMEFAAGMSVFPGGAVDPDDQVVGHLLASSYPASIGAVADQFGTNAEHAGTLVSAAIRETLEEVGVLLSEPPVVIEAADRLAVENRERGFSSMLTELTERGVEVAVDAIRPWARWITPEVETRRYDTYFFVAAVPEGLDPESVTGEASHADWISAAGALAEFKQGTRPLMPPTLACLTELADFDSTAAALASAKAREIRAIRPKLRRVGEDLSVDMGEGNLMTMRADLVTGTATPGQKKPS